MKDIELNPVFTLSMSELIDVFDVRDSESNGMDMLSDYQVSREAARFQRVMNERNIVSQHQYKL